MTRCLTQDVYKFVKIVMVFLAILLVSQMVFEEHLCLPRKLIYWNMPKFVLAKMNQGKT